MRIAFVSPTASGLFADELKYTGGAEVKQFLLAQALARRGHETVFVVADRPGLRDGAVRCLPVRFPLSARSPLARAEGTRALWEALGRADAGVYVQQGAGAITFETALFARTAGKTFVYVMASDDEWAGRVFHTNPFRRALFRQGTRWASAVVTQTERQREQVLRRWGLPARVIPGGICIPPPPDWSLKGRDVLWIGTLRWFKRPERLLDLAARLPDVPFRVLGGPWIGSGTRDARAAEDFRRRAAGLANVRWEGLLPHDATLDRLRHAAILVNTSDVEGFPTTFIEAWAGGTPVVTAGVDPDEILCRHGLGLHTSGDLDDLVAAVRRLLDDEPVRRQMGEQAAAYVRQYHDIERIADRYEALFEERAGGRAY
jgi:glycosyltransferase involved in cell wall biosynthesis